MKRFFISLHHWLETLPDKVYPFAHKIEGKWVRGKEAYQQALHEGFQLLGPGRFSLKIFIYRGAWHVFGSIVSIIAITFLARDIFGSETALYILLGTTILALCIQEFVLHPKRYGQTTRKGMFDIFTWVAPMVVYILFMVQ